MDWKYALYENKRAYASFCEENAHLWFDGFGKLGGFVVSERGHAGFHILTLSGYRFLYEQMLQWVLEIWQGRTSTDCHLSAEITEYQDCELKILERYGFRAESSFFTRRFDLARELIPRFRLEPGFVIVERNKIQYRVLSFHPCPDCFVVG